MASTEVVDLCDDSSSDGDDRKPAARQVAGVVDLLAEHPTSSAAANFRSIDLTGSTPNLLASMFPISVDEEDDRKPPANRLQQLASIATLAASTQTSAAKRLASIDDEVLVVSPPRIPLSSQTNNAKKRRRPSPQAKPKTPLDRVVEVFPDVELFHAKKLLAEQRNEVAMVLSLLAERNYPKEKRRDIAATASSTAGTSVIVERKQTYVPKYDYLCKSSFVVQRAYTDQAEQQLLYDYPFLSVKMIMSLMHEDSIAQHYSLARRYIHEQLLAPTKTNKAVSKEDQDILAYKVLKRVLTSKKVNEAERKALGVSNVLKRRRYSSQKPNVTDPILKDELYCTQLRFREWMDGIEQRLARQRARAISQRTGTSMECACCFEQVSLEEEMVACRQEGHLFCIDCIQQYANSQIFGLGRLNGKKDGNVYLKCCHGDGCESPFDEAHLQKALPMKTLEKYNEMQFRAVTEQAGLEVCTCPKCGFQAELPNTQRIFTCPMQGCHHESCRDCGKAPHIPLRCDEAAAEQQKDKGRLKVEEAISQAKIRSCPKCSTKFVKSDGCNKMTCRCGIYVCYICRNLVPKQNPYSHFCQAPHCKHDTCGKCTLYSNAEQDDERAMREAGVEAAQRFEQQVNGETQEKVRIDVDQIMANPVAARQPVRAGRQHRR